MVVSFGTEIAPAVNTRCVDLARRVRAEPWRGVRDVVEGYVTVTVHLDPAMTPAADVADSLRRLLEDAPTAERPTAAARHTTLPVCYGGEYGPDLAAVAAFGQCDQDEVVRLHAERSYRVYMLGFLPAFAYLGSVDSRIAAPRHATPRLRIPAGAVGIAGAQTGVYPRQSPGGWQIIGRCPVRLWDPGRDDAVWCQAGDVVRFEAIDGATFDRLSGAQA